MANDALLRVQLAIEGFAEKLLQPYLTSSRWDKVQRKEVNDSIWGNLVLEPIEVVLLDSPLFQRLRFIRSLGAAHWVYPSAAQTQFEHALGCLQLQQRMMDGLNEAARATPDTSAKQDPSVKVPVPFGSRDQRLLRLAVLLRHVGTIAFSDVSEDALLAMPVVAGLPSEFSAAVISDLVAAGEEVKLSQIFAYFIIRAPAMRDLLRKMILMPDGNILAQSMDVEENLKTVIEQLSTAVIGRKYDDRLPLAQDLVVGAYSSQAVDALVRDARSCGLPVVLDTQRLLQKLTAVSMPAEKLPQKVISSVDSPPNFTTWMTGFKGSGAAVLQEIQLAGILLTNKVYRHPKILAAEQMLASFVQTVVRECGLDSALHLLYFHSDDALLHLDVDKLHSWLGLTAEEPRPALRDAADLLASLRERRLWVRALLLPETIEFDDDEPVQIVNLRVALESLGRAQDELIGPTADEVHQQLQLLGRSRERGSLDVLISLRRLPLQSSETEVGRAYMLQRSAPAFQYGDRARRRQGGSWLDQYYLEQNRLYVFCPADIADAVYLAFQKVAYEHFGAVLPPSVAEASKRSDAVLDDHKMKLLEQGYWRSMPFELRPTPPCLKEASIGVDIERFLKVRAKYQTPETVMSDPRSREDEEELTRRWLKQFGNNDHVRYALHLLGGITLIDRKEVVGALKSFLNEHKEFLSAAVIPFGSVKDSSGLQAYFADDLRTLGVSAQSLEEYQRAGCESPLIFIDDVIGTGRQAEDILSAWLGNSDGRNLQLNETRHALSEEIAEILRHRRIAFFFIAGWDEGLRTMQDGVKQAGLDAIVHVHLREDKLNFAEDVLRSKNVPQPSIDTFLARCREIGRQLILSEDRDVPISEKVALDRALGYGNRGMLLTTLVNTPSQSLTALWKAGSVDGADWSPIFLRRKKL